MSLHHTKLWIIFALAAAAHAQVIASIGGQVFDVATNEPVNGATLVLTEAMGSSRPIKFVTATRGLFLFEKLPPGRYVLFADCPGYARTEFGSRGNPLAGITLSLVEGQQMDDLAFGLAPAATISGKVVDAAGGAVARATVLALRAMYQRGKKEYIPLASAVSDSSGEYKLENLSAGGYVLAANDGFGAATTWYPNSALPSGADLVTVSAGAQETGREIHLAAVPGHRVAGAMSSGGKAAIAWLTPKGGATSLISRVAATIQPDGKFVFPHIAAGLYVLSATEEDGVTAASAPIAVTVAQKDVEDLTLFSQGGGELSGEVALGANDVALPRGMQIVLEATDAPLPRPARADVDEHGKFTFLRLPRGHYAVHLLVSGAIYVRSVRYAGADVLENGFDFGGGPAPLLIGLSASGASLSGSVRGADGSAMPGATVALIPTLRRFSRYKEVTTDQFGEYHFDGIAPGDYNVFAWDHIDTGAYEDAAWIKKYEFKGQPFLAKPGGRETIALKALQ